MQILFGIFNLTWDVLGNILYILGSLGMFLFGMKLMSEGLQKSAGDGLHKIMNIMTANRFMAVFTGFLITTLIQSSSATTVMVVSFVNAGLLTLTQSIGVILGANIGTTVTGWLVAILGFKFKIAAIALPAIGIGLPLLFIKRLKGKNIGEILTGFGLLFIGLDFLKKWGSQFKGSEEVMEFIAAFSSNNFDPVLFVVFVLLGALLTVLVQSSSAAMAMTITMASLGWIDFKIAAFIVLGENIGTTITAYLASIGTNVNARRASRAHTLFNLIGVAWMALAFPLFFKLVDAIVPGQVFNVGTEIAKENIPAHLAMFHTLFNITNCAIFLYFIPQFAKLIEKMVRPTKADEAQQGYTLKYISTALQDTPELHIVNARAEISKMTEIVSQMFSEWFSIFKHVDKKMGNEVEVLKEKEDMTDQMEEQLSTYLVTISSDNLSESGHAEVSSLMRIVNELESIGDSCFNLILLAERRYNKKLEFDQASIDKLLPYCDDVKKFLTFIKQHLDSGLNDEELLEARNLENTINDQRNMLKKAARKRIQKGSSVKSELLYIDIIRHVEQIGDFCINIAEHMPYVSNK